MHPSCNTKEGVFQHFMAQWGCITLGLLMNMPEYIDGFGLRELSIFCPKDQGQSVGEDAIHIIHCLNSAGIWIEMLSCGTFLFAGIRRTGSRLSWLIWESACSVTSSKTKKNGENRNNFFMKRKLWDWLCGTGWSRTLFIVGLSIGKGWTRNLTLNDIADIAHLTFWTDYSILQWRRPCISWFFYILSPI